MKMTIAIAMTFTSVMWQYNIFPCIKLEKDQQIIYDETINYNNSCLLKVDITSLVSLIN